MKLFLDYFGLGIFAFVVFVGGLVALPELGGAPETSVNEMIGLVLAFVVIAGGFSWYYFSTSVRQGPADQHGPRKRSP
jgi:hypothetical protein